MGLLTFTLKLAPLALFARAALCKLDLPFAACDGPLCPVVQGQNADCTPSFNTAELKYICETGFQPWLAELLSKVPPNDFYKPKPIPCDAESDYLLLKMIGIYEIVAYTLLWSSPRLGAWLFIVQCAFMLHYHISYEKKLPQELIPQWAVLGGSVLVFLLSGGSSTSKSAVKKVKTT